MDKLGYKYRFISNTLFDRLPEEQGFFWLGNAIYSKYPLYDAVAHKLNYNRTCIFATIIHPITQVKYIVATTHLSFYDEARDPNNTSFTQQLRNVSGLLADYMTKSECYNVILGGDFNHPSKENYYPNPNPNCVSNIFNSVLIKSNGGNGFLLDLMFPFDNQSYPANNHFTGFHNQNFVDRFLVSPNITKHHVYTTGYIKNFCSDHYPIFIDIEPNPNPNPVLPNTLYDPSLPEKMYKYKPPLTTSSDILNMLVLAFYDNMTYASDQTYTDLHYGLSMNIMENLIYGNNILNNSNIPQSIYHLSTKSLITVIQPDYINPLLDAKLHHKQSCSAQLTTEDTRFTHPLTNYRGMSVTELMLEPYLHVNPQCYIQEISDRQGLNSRLFSKDSYKSPPHRLWESGGKVPSPFLTDRFK
jgi:endonuclease/exonuclease/phosphatase family metal-dependent hydrolase